MWKNVFKKILPILILYSIAFRAPGQQNEEAVYFPEHLSVNNQWPNKPSSISHEQLLQKASGLYDMGAYEDAILLYDLVIRDDPYQAQAYFGRAICREQLAQFEKALVDYEIVRNLAPGMQEAYFNNAVLSFSLKAYEKAIPLFEALLILPESNTQMLYFKGVKYSEETKPLLSGISTLQGKDTKAIVYDYLGRSYDALGNFTEAEAYYTQAIALGPSAELFISRGKLRKAQERYEEAIADFRNALKTDPENSLALYLLAITANKAGNASLTIKVLDEVIAGNRAFPEVYSHRGLLKYKAGDYAGAVADYDSAIILDPGMQDAWLNRGLAKGKLLNFSGAVRDFNHVIQYDKENPKAYLYRGNAYFQMKQYKAAVKDYDRALALNSASANAYYNRALANHELQQAGQVCEDLKKAIALGMEVAEKAKKAYCQ